MVATKDTFFSPEKVSARDKAAHTDLTARAILESEVRDREKKTEKLKALRLQREADAAAEAPAKTPRRAKSPAKA